MFIPADDKQSNVMYLVHAESLQIRLSAFLILQPQDPIDNLAAAVLNRSDHSYVVFPRLILKTLFGVASSSSMKQY